MLSWCDGLQGCSAGWSVLVAGACGPGSQHDGEGGCPGNSMPWGSPLRIGRLWARLRLRHDDERYRRVAGQADRDRADHAVGGVGRTAGDDRHVLIWVGFADGGGRCTQLIGDDALASLELPGCSGDAQLRGGLDAKLLLYLIEV